MLLGLLFQVADRGLVMGEVGIDLGDNTVLACDAALLRAPLTDDRLLSPHDVGLVVEVAQTSLARDQGTKRVLYAAAAIPEYWVVDGDRAVVHVYREPLDGDYALISTVRFGEPLAVPGTGASITPA
jgi:Uma2 family endonuclease